MIRKVTTDHRILYTIMKITTPEFQFAILFPVLLLLMSPEHTAGRNIPVITTTSNKSPGTTVTNGDRDNTNIVFTDSHLQNALIPELITENANIITLSDKSDEYNASVEPTNNKGSSTFSVPDSNQRNSKGHKGFVPSRGSETNHPPTKKKLLETLVLKSKAYNSGNVSKSLGEANLMKVPLIKKYSEVKSRPESKSQNYSKQKMSITELKSIALDTGRKIQSPAQTALSSSMVLNNDHPIVVSTKLDSVDANFNIIIEQKTEQQNNEQIADTLPATKSHTALTSRTHTNKVEGSSTNNVRNIVLLGTHSSDKIHVSDSPAVKASIHDEQHLIEKVASNGNNIPVFTESRSDSKSVASKSQEVAGAMQFKSRPVAALKIRIKTKRSQGRPRHPLAEVCKKLKQKGLPTPPSCSKHNFDTWT